MQSVLSVKRIKFNRNLGTIDEFTPTYYIDMDNDYPIGWETYQWKPKRKEHIFLKIFLFSGKSIIVDMTVEQWQEYYGKFKEAYELVVENRNPPPVLEA